ncbi:helix-turn-helix domain-containing protein [Streptomyces sp. NPDC088353]|uniref:helix-turn-helix domain-containing protein n=1 Tax=Streptomyces sp. NPDC088353 TaxID=3365855 RepID=UPI0038305E0A
MSSYRLRSARLQEAAAARGDHSNYAIAKRTGLNQATLSRICRGVAEPATKTLLTLASTYGLSIDELIDQAAQAQPSVRPSAAARNSVGPEVQSGSAARNDEATRGPAGSPLSSKSAPTSK